MINKNIRSLRQHLSLTQKDFSKILGLAENTVCLMETGKRKISNKTIETICSTFNVNKDWLINNQGDMFINQDLDKKTSFLMGKIMASATSEDLLIKNLFYDLCHLDSGRLKILQEIINSWK